MTGALQERQPDQTVQQHKGQQQREMLAELREKAQEIARGHVRKSFQRNAAAAPVPAGRMVHAPLSMLESG
jgi:hypothetical protein